MEEDLKPLFDTLESWGKQWEDFAETQSKREEEAAKKLAEYLFDSVTVDGSTLRDIYGNPSDLMHGNFYMTRHTSARSMLKQMTMQSATGEAVEVADDIEFSYEIPSKGEIDEFF